MGDYVVDNLNKLLNQFPHFRISLKDVPSLFRILGNEKNESFEKMVYIWIVELNKNNHIYQQIIQPIIELLSDVKTDFSLSDMGYLGLILSLAYHCLHEHEFVVQEDIELKSLLQECHEELIKNPSMTISNLESYVNQRRNELVGVFEKRIKAKKV